MYGWFIAMLPCPFKPRAHIQVHPQRLAPARGIAGQRTVLEFPNRTYRASQQQNEHPIISPCRCTTMFFPRSPRTPWTKRDLCSVRKWSLVLTESKLGTSHGVLESIPVSVTTLCVHRSPGIDSNMHIQPFDLNSNTQCSVIRKVKPNGSKMEISERPITWH